MKIEEAMGRCKVRGYIARISNPDVKHWKNTLTFSMLLYGRLSFADRTAEDWNTYDPEADEYSLVG
ncbi:MAG TPA: hypothetical protein ENI23_07715 [bacterium]|nr:hypothetical protein [bacterium]